MPIAMKSKTTSFSTVTTADANAVLNKPVAQALMHQTSTKRPVNANAIFLLMQTETKKLLTQTAMLSTKTSSSTAAAAVVNAALNKPVAQALTHQTSTIRLADANAISLLLMQTETKKLLTPTAML